MNQVPAVSCSSTSNTCTIELSDSRPTSVILQTTDDGFHYVMKSYAAENAQNSKGELMYYVGRAETLRGSSALEHLVDWRLARVEGSTANLNEDNTPLFRIGFERNLLQIRFNTETIMSMATPGLGERLGHSKYRRRAKGRTCPDRRSHWSAGERCAG